MNVDENVLCHLWTAFRYCLQWGDETFSVFLQNIITYLIYFIKYNDHMFSNNKIMGILTLHCIYQKLYRRELNQMNKTLGCSSDLRSINIWSWSDLRRNLANLGGSWSDIRYMYFLEIILDHHLRSDEDPIF